MSMAEEAGQKYREVHLHTEPQVIETSFWQKLGAACGCNALQCVAGDGPAMSNEIQTSKYTLITFIPVNLFEQFCRVANLYFLVTAVLQLIPGLSPTSWFTTVFPLIVVLLVNGIKEGYDDYHRHKNDSEINSRTVLVLSQGGKETPTQWRDVIVGDIVKVMQDQEVPADIVCLSTSDEEHLCHVETANLDGETNLKLKYAFNRTANVHTADQLLEFEHSCVVHCELPSPKLYVFDGAVIDKLDPDSRQEPLTVDNLLLRGCTLRKTNWVIGMVAYVGNDTKIMMNRTVSPRKITQLERHMNILVIVMFSIEFFFACMLAAGDQIFRRLHKGLWYLQYNDKWPDYGLGFRGWVIQVIRFIILLNGMIPISLYVTLEIVKVIQCVMLYSSDRQMYHKESDTPFSCRTTTLNEDLGQVQYVLSDKTGTLTQNVMGFVWASIDGALYGRPTAPQNSLRKPDKPRVPAHIEENTPHTIALDKELHAKLGSHFAALEAAATASNGSRPSLGPTITGPTNTDEPDPAVARFLISLAVCNTVVPQVLEDGRFVYQAASPDEEALVEGAASLGYRLESRSTDRVEVRYHGQVWVYQVLAVLEFNSDRKRMSVICKCPDGKVRLFCKGADTMIMARIRAGQHNSNAVRAHLEEMAQAGYRTLCVAEKEINETAWKTWWEQYHAASVSLDGREEKIAAAAERIESGMDLVGATAVEDKLQEGVPEAIEQLIAAGIKVWVLTGDKVETAISIALSCRLFCEDMALVELRERDFISAAVNAGAIQQAAAVREGSAPKMDFEGAEVIEHQVLQEKIDEVESENIRMEFEGIIPPRPANAPPVTAPPPGTVQGRTNVGLVIEGGALALALKKEHHAILMQLCNGCKSVVCCRVSPMQKAAVTKLVQVKCGAITLGIGDGANDVGMIQAAHIGCGISGREGRAAVLASDFAFAQFKYVARLILLHGRAAYKRNCEVVLYSFYKNWLHNLTYVFFAFVTGYSCQPLYTSGLIATMNLFWASLPIIAFACLEQDVSPDTLKANPKLYTETMLSRRKDFLTKQFKWCLLGTWHSLINWFVPVYSMWVPDRKGLYDDWVAVGTTVYTATVVTINLKMAMRTRYWTWINAVLIFLSVALFFPFLWLYGLVWPVAQIDGTAEMNDIAKVVYPSPRYWLAGFLLAPAMSLLLDITIMCFQRTFMPTHAQVLQEVEYMEEVRSQALRELGVGNVPASLRRSVPKNVMSYEIEASANMTSPSMVVDEPHDPHAEARV